MAAVCTVTADPTSPCTVNMAVTVVSDYYYLVVLCLLTPTGDVLLLCVDVQQATGTVPTF